MNLQLELHFQVLLMVSSKRLVSWFQHVSTQKLTKQMVPPSSGRSFSPIEGGWKEIPALAMEL
jgi:hypothetical protein